MARQNSDVEMALVEQGNSLHEAARLGNSQSVQRILDENPELAGQLDSRHWSPLHFAAEKGHLQVVEILARVNPDMCSHRDQCWKNPLHIAASNGHVNVLKFLLESIHNHKFLNFHEFLNSKDDQGNTILHLAVNDKKRETIKFLTEKTSIEVNALNAKGLTALDISKQKKYLEIEKLLGSAGAESGKNVLSDQHWMANQRNNLIVAAALIATIAFQVGVNPPGGLWQENPDARTGAPPPTAGPLGGATESHLPGHSIMADNYPSTYRAFVSCNTIGFLASVSIIVLLTTGLPFKYKDLMWIVRFIMWVALTALALTYLFSVACVTPQMDLYVITLCAGTLTILFLMGTIFYWVAGRTQGWVPAVQFQVLHA